ncbi:MAG TPA: phosphatase PAP2 family protein [Rhodopila sp.]|uniref:phosphatase PAP2 family protein n=1 Tax=Rhodopila sp. TaxID=2480087 RepID=UPI002C69A7A7|nr:phosphatase PAP2 family protein [Rhodopila sp.]HVY16016.1 phosphatase PAP2 family protein [Rhodopila sp.]
MRILNCLGAAALLLSTFVAAPSVNAQTAANLAALRGLAPVAALQNTDAGKAALAANLAVTGAIQQGTANQPGLRPFAEEQQQALRDAFITGGNALELADGLGTKLDGAYQAVVQYKSADDGKTSAFTNLSPAVAHLIAYASTTERADSALAKFFFANETLDGKTRASGAAIGILTAIAGSPDFFGKAYGRPAGSDGANRYGNSRPFMTQPHLLVFEGKDFFGVQSGNLAYLRGPAQDLVNSPSYPSGHTAYGYTEALLLALLVPERYPEMVARAAEYGNSRIIMGAHYAMDVLGGRTLATYDLAQLLANRPGYAGVNRHGLVIGDFRKAVRAARADLARVLASGCGNRVVVCARQDDGRFADPAKDQAFYEATQTYGLPVVHQQAAAAPEDVAKLAPEAGYLLTVAFPYLTLARADAILTATEGPGGGFLDDGSAFGVYSRLDLYRASKEAIAAGHDRHRGKTGNP